MLFISKDCGNNYYEITDSITSQSRICDSEYIKTINKNKKVFGVNSKGLISVWNPSKLCNRLKLLNDGFSFSFDNKYIYVNSCNINSPKIVIPEGVMCVAYCCSFNSSTIQNIILPSTLVAINSYGVKDCKYLEEIIIPDTVEYIGNKAFQSCIRLKRVILPRFLYKIGKDCFELCESLQEIVCKDRQTYQCLYAMKESNRVTRKCAIILDEK